MLNFKLFIGLMILLSLTSCYKCMECQVYDINGSPLMLRNECGTSEKNIKEKISDSSSGGIDPGNITCK